MCVISEWTLSHPASAIVESRVELELLSATGTGVLLVAGGTCKKGGVGSVVLSPEVAGDAGYCHLSQPMLKNDIHGEHGRRGSRGTWAGGGSCPRAISYSHDGAPLLSSVLRGSCFLGGLPGILTVTVTASLEAEGPRC